MKKGNCPLLSTIFIKLTSKMAKKPYVRGLDSHEMALLQFPLPKQSSWPSSFHFCDSIKTTLQTLFYLQRRNIFLDCSSISYNWTQLLTLDPASDHLSSFQANTVRVTRKHANQEQVVLFAVNHRRKRTKKW